MLSSVGFLSHRQSTVRIMAPEVPQAGSGIPAALDATGHRVVPMGKDQTMLYFTVPAWAAVYGIICRIALARLRKLIM